MGEEVRITDYYVGGGGGGHGGGGGEEEDDDRVMEWEAGLPNVDDLTPLSQSLISPELLSAFSISPEPYRSMTDVNRASQNTLSNMRDASEKNKHPSSAEKFTGLNSFSDDKGGEEMVLEEEGEEETADLTLDGSEMRKLRRLDSGDDGAGAGAGCGEEAESESGLLADDSSARTSSKRPRLVWTPQLHKRFVDVVAHLGVKNAVPKTIMNLMNVEGLTRENVASHLQKYRLYLKRMQGLSSQGPSSSDHLFASTPIPQEFGGGNGGNGNGGHRYGPPASYPAQMVHMPYPSPQIVPNGGGGYGYGYESNSYPYNNVSMQQQRDWSGNKFGSVSSYQQQHRMTPNDK